MLNSAPRALVYIKVGVISVWEICEKVKMCREIGEKLLDIGTSRSSPILSFSYPLGHLLARATFWLVYLTSCNLQESNGT